MGETDRGAGRLVLVWVREGGGLVLAWSNYNIFSGNLPFQKLG